MVHSLQRCVSELPWASIAADLSAYGHAVTGPLLDPAACRRIAAWYGDDKRFRSRVVMERHAFGKGEYKYFSYPLPAEVEALREALYGALAPIANAWAAALKSGLT